MLKIVVAGCTGRMGQAIIREISISNNLKLVGALTRRGNESIGIDAGLMANVGALDVLVTAQLPAISFDVMIDFSQPAGLPDNIKICEQYQRAIVVGTTGLGEVENNLLTQASKNIPVLFAANTSVGINLCAALVEMASKVIGEITDIEIVEAHHNNKVDAPSGTALLLGEAVACAMNKDISDLAVFSREGHIEVRKRGSIGFSTIRGGDIVGEHTVMFIGKHERIEITHRATNRKIFAQGAIRAAAWLTNEAIGLYAMQDVLDL